MAGHKYMSYSKPIIWKKHRFYGNFPPTIKKEDYEYKKANAFQEIKGKEYNEDTKLLYERNILLKYLNQHKKTTYKAITELFNTYNIIIDKSTISRATRNLPRIRENVI